MSIILTEAAAKHVQKSLQKRGKGIGLRLGVKKSGCSGFSYAIEYVDELSENDEIFESQGVKIFVASEHLAFLNGLQVDFTRQGLNQTFTFHNPNVKNTCGCGESFSL